MGYQFLAVRREGPVEHVTLNRPEVRNAFNERVIAELSDWAQNAAEDEGLRVVVLAGAGKVFSAGADAEWMARMADSSHQDNVEDAARAASMFRAINALPCVVIGRIHGAALGGGSGLAAVCDIVITDRHRAVRLYRDQARHPARHDLAVRAAEDRDVGRAGVVPHGHALQRPTGP